jgi:hypothetical protein
MILFEIDIFRIQDFGLCRKYRGVFGYEADEEFFEEDESTGKYVPKHWGSRGRSNLRKVDARGQICGRSSIDRMGMNDLNITNDSVTCLSI